MAQRRIEPRVSGRCLRTLVVVLLMAPLSWTASADQAPRTTPQCHASGSVEKLPDLAEASGVAASRVVAGRLWSLNDSGDPVLLALSDQGAVTGRVRLSGVVVDDWEAISVGPCPSGSCLYVADIGDNKADRKQVTVYRVPEPEKATEAVAVSDVFHATYPDGPHDAEALLVTPKGDVFIVTKDVRAMYRFPSGMRPGATVKLERVGNPGGSGPMKADARITDGAVSPNGAWVVLRTNRELLFYKTADLMLGNWRESGRVGLEQISEPQGEGVAFGNDNTLYLVGEGGGKSRSGTFVRLTCSP